jgi:SAM-dependent methyltransferase
MLRKIADRFAFGRTSWDPVAYWSRRAADPGTQSVMWDNPVFNELVDRSEWALVERYLPGERGAVLDLGCGTGRLSERLAARFGAYTGVDLGPMVEEAARRTPSLADRFVEATVSTYDYPRERFDLVLSMGCLATACTADALEPTLRRILGSLRPGGRVILIEPFHRHRLLTRGCRVTGEEALQLVHRCGAHLIASDGLLFPLTRVLLSSRALEGHPRVTRGGHALGEWIVRLSPMRLSDYKVIVADRTPSPP